MSETGPGRGWDKSQYQAQTEYQELGVCRSLRSLELGPYLLRLCIYLNEEINLLSFVKYQILKILKKISIINR